MLSKLPILSLFLNSFNKINKICALMCYKGTALYKRNSAIQVFNFDSHIIMLYLFRIHLMIHICVFDQKRFRIFSSHILL